MTTRLSRLGTGGDELSGSIKCRIFLDYPRICWLSTNNSAARTMLVRWFWLAVKASVVLLVV
jgi:hypothetical protein